MKMKKLLPFLLIAGLIGCAKVKDPEFRRIEKFRLKDLGLQNAVIGLSVTYYNPNNFGVTVKEAAVDVYMDSIYLGKFVQDSVVAVNRNAEFSLPLSGSIALKTALQQNPQAVGTRPILIKAEGAVKVGKAGIFVTREVHYEGRHSLSEISIQ
jgi:LEA14-like dessication related protein